MAKKYIWFIVIVMVFVSCFMLFGKNPSLSSLKQTKYKVDTEFISYDSIKQNISRQKLLFQNAYSSTEDKKQVVKQAKEYLIKTITDSVFTCWYNTPWNFNGTTQTPKKGTIACGYFVTTVLKDAGFNIPRIKWAQITSEEVIKKTSTNIKRFHKQDIEKVIEYLNQQENGLFLVGLDCHIGFIYKKNSLLRFVHSSYYQPKIGVLSEPLKGWNPLNDSKYRVIGELLSDDMVVKWLTNYKYE